MDFISGYLLEIFPGNTQPLSGLGFIAALFVSYVGGLLASLTPCIYPMIPITISVVGGVGNPSDLSTHRGAGFFTKVLFYVLGMALVYATLGVLAGLTGSVFGTMTQTPGWYLSIGVILTGASLWMLDVFYFDPVYFLNHVLKLGLSNQSSKIRKEKTHITAFVLGASSGFIAAPCTTPIMAAILAFIAQERSVVIGLAMMLSFSLGLGTLLVCLAFFAGRISALPKSGGWLKQIKLISGLILLAFAQYLIFQAGRLGG